MGKEVLRYEGLKLRGELFSSAWLILPSFHILYINSIFPDSEIIAKLPHVNVKYFENWKLIRFLTQLLKILPWNQEYSFYLFNFFFFFWLN